MFDNYENYRLRKIASLVTGKAILDIGCAQLPNKYLSAEKIIGTDIKAMEVRPPYSHHIVCDIFDIKKELNGQKFDTVIMGEFIEHVEQPYELLRYLKDILKPDGQIIISTPNPLGIPVILAELFASKKYFYTQDHLYYFVPRWIWRMLDKSGYEILQTMGCGAKLGSRRVPIFKFLSYILIYVAITKN